MFEAVAGSVDIVLPATVVARIEKLLDEALARTAADTPVTTDPARGAIAVLLENSNKGSNPAPLRAPINTET